MVDEIANQIIASGMKAFDHPTLEKIETHKRTCKRLWKLAEIKGIRQQVQDRLTEILEQKQEVAK